MLQYIRDTYPTLVFSLAAQVIHLLEYHNVGGLVFILHITNTNLVTAGLQRHIVYTDKVHQLNNKQSGHVSILIQYKMVKPSLVTVTIYAGYNEARRTTWQSHLH